MAWEPGRRKAARALEMPFPDVPDHLYPGLLGWIAGGLNSYGRVGQLYLRLRVELPSQRPAEVLIADCRADSDLALEVVEEMLSLWGIDGGRAVTLQTLLLDANSLYTINDSANGLAARQPAAVQGQVKKAVAEAAGSAGDHLTDAWNAAYARVPDPVTAYREAVKAVESAFVDLISPQNDLQTLGTMRTDVRQAPHKWAFTIPDGRNSNGVQTVLAMMELLWEGHTSRHGSQATRNETVEEAQAAVQLAVTLVQWASSGAFKKKG